MIHPTAIIHPDAWLSEDCVVEPFAIVGSDHGPLELYGATIRSHSIIEGGSDIAPGLETGHGVLIRDGNVIGRNLRIGTGSSLEGGGVIGDYVRLHGRVEMTKGIIRDFARVYANCYITDNKLPPSNVNEPAIIDEGAVLTIGCVVVAGVRVGVGSFVGANTTVTKDVPDGMALVGGVYKSVADLRWKDYHYPWTGYYRDGYPPESLERLTALHERIMEFVDDQRAEAKVFYNGDPRCDCTAIMRPHTLHEHWVSE